MRNDANLISKVGHPFKKTGLGTVGIMEIRPDGENEGRRERSMHTPEVVERPGSMVRRPLSQRHPIKDALETQTPGHKPTEVPPRHPE